MPSLTVCDSLTQEHRHMESLLETLQQALSNPQAFREAETVMTLIAQDMDTHFACEEQALFPALSPTHPMMLMEAEHEDLMALRHDLMTHLTQDDATPAHVDTVKQLAQQFIHDMLDHISREDAGIFPLAEQVLSDEEKASVIAGMNAIRHQASSRINTS